MKKYAITFAILFLMFSVLIAEQLEPKVAPINPEYVKYMELFRKGKVKRFTSDGYPLGYVPHPLKFKTDISAGLDRTSVLPELFDLRDEAALTEVDSQDVNGPCWTFATMHCLESRWIVMGEGVYDLSENNVLYGHGFKQGPEYGGNQVLSTAYLARGSGPILEEDDPYQYLDGSYHPGLTPVAYVPDAHFLPNDMNTLKQNYHKEENQLKCPHVKEVISIS